MKPPGEVLPCCYRTLFGGEAINESFEGEYGETWPTHQNLLQTRQNNPFLYFISQRMIKTTYLVTHLVWSHQQDSPAREA